jgi:inhibitor of cysteine peptidase
VAELTLGMADDGHAVAADRADLIVIELPENPTTGYRWSLRSKVEPALRLERDSFRPPRDPRPGAGGNRRFEFSAAAAGSAKILLWNWRDWEGEGSVAARYAVTVTVR